MRQYEFVGHTADTQIRITGHNLQELFRAGLAGMNNIIIPHYCEKHSEFPVQESIQIDSPDRTALLIDFLSEVLYLSQTHHILYCHVQFDKLNSSTIEGTLSGQKVNGFEEDIKAVTYHQAQIQEDQHGNWKTDIIFDI